MHRKRKLIRLIVAATIMAALAAASLFSHVVNYGLGEDQGDADVIIVLGAAVWPGGPSPALRARVWRGSTLFHQGRAPHLIFSGGLGRYPPAEAEAMAVLALSWQVDEKSIYLEDRAANTRENMAFAAAIMQQQGWETAIIVTDYFHMKRAVLLARDYGIVPVRAPVSVQMSHYVPRERLFYTLRECAALIDYYARKILIRAGIVMACSVR